MGAAVPPVLASQIASGILVGSMGGLVGPRLLNIGSRLTASLAAGTVGFMLTFIFQVFVNVASFYAFMDERAVSALWKYVFAGLVFTITHLVWNTGVFFLILMPLLSVLDRHRLEMR